MSDFTTLRVGQLAEEVWSGTDNLPHEVGSELKRGTVANLATYIASVIDASEGLAFNPLKITDGQTLPTTTDNEWILAGKGTYLQGGGFASVVCTDDINVITSNGVSWSFSFGIVIEIPESVSEKFPLTSPNSTVTVGGALANTVLADRTAIDVLTEILIVYLYPQFTSKACNYPSIVEVGTMVSGIYTFTWAISNATNIVPNSVNIFDLNANNFLVTGLANDGSEAVALNGNTLNANNATQVWSISAENTKSEVLESGNIVTTAIYPIFYGKSNSQPTANQALIDGGTKAIVTSTGTLNITFGASGQYLWFAHPALNPTKTKWYVNALNNGNIGSISDLFNAPTTVNITTALWNGIPYKIYISNIPTTTSGNMELKNS